MSEEIPQWAKAMAVQLMGEDVDSLVALARYIAAHEQPPVDPDVIAVREIAAALCRNGGMSLGGELKPGSAAETAAAIAFRKHKEAGK